MPARLIVYKASAGSGKTYRLTEEYLLLLFRHPEKYRHILAVTFTNKATAEMKDRILTELGKLANGTLTGHQSVISKELNLPVDAVMHTAQQLLLFILHDYSRFTIETIDSFFQRVFRSFTHEINLPGNLSIELDYSTYLEQTIDLMLQDSPDNERLQRWVKDYASYRISQGKNWNFREQLYELSQQIFNEKYRLLSGQLDEKLLDKSIIQNYQTSCQQIIEAHEATIKKLGQEAMSLIRGSGLGVDDFAFRSTGVAGFFEKCASGTKITEIKDRQRKAALGEDTCWFTAKSTNSDVINQLREKGLDQLLNRIIDLEEKQSAHYYTALAVVPNLYTLGLLSDVSRQLRSLAEEQNVFFLSDTGPLISAVIDDNPVPFLYEKMGNRYRHYMMDEFQDTSEIQWNNFKPLVEETLASGHDNLIVGDVKQSIYRWRNSNWNILASRLNKEFSDSVLHQKTLRTNWRSCANIVFFNNVLYSALPDYLQQEFNTSHIDTKPNIFSDLITTAYADANQQLPEGKTNDRSGYVQVNLIEEKDWQTAALEKMIDILKSLLVGGKRFGDIAILVRNKNEGQLVANSLLANQQELSEISGHELQLISNSGLSLHRANGVKLVIGILKYLIKPHDKVNTGYIAVLLTPEGNGQGIHHEDLHTQLTKLFPPEFNENIETYRNQPLYQVVEKIISVFNLNKDTFQQAFLYAFLDSVADFTRNHSSDISSFLDWWETEGPKQSVSNSGGTNAVQIMTIHKSKGLEFNTVILPFANWNMDKHPGKGDVIWCQPTQAPFNDLPLVPVHYTTTLAKTIFAETYEFERIQNLVDNLNVLYVATTRAEENLFLLTPKVKVNGLQKTAHLLNIFFENHDYTTLQDASFENNEFVFGKPDYSITANKLVAPDFRIMDVRTEHTSLLDNLSQELGHRIVFREKKDKSGDSVIDFGKVMHWIFERINYMTDIEIAVQASVREGLTESKAQDELVQLIKQKITSAGVEEWYSTEFVIRSEKDMLVPGSGSKRPDRVMIKDTKAVVLDYKFGEMHEQKHAKQVNEYKQLISQMGYHHIEGYVWYVMHNRVVEV